MKKNCWEYIDCGRHIKNKLGVCPVAKDSRLDGIHGGTNGGRACWLVSDTLCGGKPNGTFTEKVAICSSCGFYKKVMTEERSFKKLSINSLREVWVQKNP